jgi:hypothetical protein
MLNIAKVASKIEELDNMLDVSYDYKYIELTEWLLAECLKDMPPTYSLNEVGRALDRAYDAMMEVKNND